MKRLILALLLAGCGGSAPTGELDSADAAALRAAVEMLAKAAAQGDADTVIASTHPALVELAGGPENYAGITRGAMNYLREQGFELLRLEVGSPSRTYAAGKEEVSFVPRVMDLQLGEAKVRSTSFMIAIRRVGSKEWKFIDGAGLKRNPEVLQKLLPALDKAAVLPENSDEKL
jgi:hypothetical protein